MTIGTVIVHYEQWDLLLRCLSALGHTGGDVVVIDNASPTLPPNAEERVLQASAGCAKLVRNPDNEGFGRACNRGVALLGERAAYLLLNPDVEVEPGAITALCTLLEERPDIGIVGPRLSYPDGTIQDSYRRFPRPIDQIIKRTPLRKARFLRDRVRSYLMWDKDQERTEEVDWLVGACLLVRHATWERIGGFDPRFFLFFEDVDLCRRSWEAGFGVVYHPAARCIHAHQRLSAGGPLALLTKHTLRIHLLSALRYFWKWRHRPYPTRTPLP